MADGYRRKCTWTGRVVYDRKPTPFKLRDVYRILSKMYWADVLVTESDTAIAVAAIEKLRQLLNDAGFEPPDVSGGGGGFGGGGATRPIPDSDSSESGSEPGSGIPFVPAPIRTDLGQFLDDDEEGEDGGDTP